MGRPTGAPAWPPCAWATPPGLWTSCCPFCGPTHYSVETPSARNGSTTGNWPMDLIGVLSNQALQGSLGRLVKKLAAVRASGEPRRQPVACRQRPRRPGWVLTAVLQVLAIERSRCEPGTSIRRLRRCWGSRWRGRRSRWPWRPMSRVPRLGLRASLGGATCWHRARRRPGRGARGCARLRHPSALRLMMAPCPASASSTAS